MTQFSFVGVQELLRRWCVQAGVPPDADVQPDQVPVGEEPRREVRLRGHLRQGLPRAPPQGQRSLCQSLSTKEEGNAHFF